MKKKFIILICAILLASSSFSCTKADNTEENTDLITYNEELMYKQAEALTKHILNNALKMTHIDSNEKITFSSRDIFDFVVTLFIYREDLEHPYNNIPEIKTEDYGLFVHYNFDDIQRAVEELFGVPDWFDPFLEDFYDEESNKIISSIEKGMPGQHFTYENIEITSLPDTNYIETKFELIYFNPYEAEKGTENLGIYKLIFEVMNENDKAFLRIHSLESVK